MESQLVLLSVAAVTVLSGAAATIITLTVDGRKRPLIQSVVEGLMRIALLGAGTLVALSTEGVQIWSSVICCSCAGRLRALAAIHTGLAPRRRREQCSGLHSLDGLGLTPYSSCQITFQAARTPARSRSRTATSLRRSP
jgi:hypothetical protein